MKTVTASSIVPTVSSSVFKFSLGLWRSASVRHHPNPRSVSTDPHSAEARYCSSSCVVTTPPLPLLPWFTLGRWLGFGFITFEAEQSVDQAVNMHFHDIMGKKVCSCSFILPIRSNGGLGDEVTLLYQFLISACSVLINTLTSKITQLSENP